MIMLLAWLRAVLCHHRSHHFVREPMTAGPEGDPTAAVSQCAALRFPALLEPTLYISKDWGHMLVKNYSSSEKYLRKTSHSSMWAEYTSKVPSKQHKNGWPPLGTLSVNHSNISKINCPHQIRSRSWMDIIATQKNSPSDTFSKTCVTFSDSRMCMFKYLVKIPVLFLPCWTSKASASSHLHRLTKKSFST